MTIDRWKCTTIEYERSARLVTEQAAALELPVVVVFRLPDGPEAWDEPRRRQTGEHEFTVRLPISKATPGIVLARMVATVLDLNGKPADVAATVASELWARVHAPEQLEEIHPARSVREIETMARHGF